MISRVVVLPSFIFWIRSSRWVSDWGPTGMTRMPPGASCSRSGGGISGAAAVTRIASKGACFLPAEIPVAGPARNVRRTHFLEVSPRRLSELGEDLDGVYVADEAREHGRLVARARSNLEHHVVLAGLGELGHERDDVGLRDGLPFTDGQRVVGVGPRP